MRQQHQRTTAPDRRPRQGPAGPRRGRSGGGLARPSPTERGRSAPPPGGEDGQAPARSAGGDRGAADHDLALYLRQMGSTPLLDRQQEGELAERVDRLRRRYRHAALCSWPVLGRLVETFTAIEAGRLPLGRHIDEVPDLGVSRDSVRRRLPGHLAELRRLLRGPAPQQHGRAARREEGRRLR